VYLDFVPTSDEAQREFGRFRLRAEECIDYLNRHFKEHSVLPDKALLEWLSDLSEDSQTLQPGCIPEHLEERARYLVEEFWDCPDACEVFCTACHRVYGPPDVSVDTWIDAADVQGITVGASGIRLVCPLAHNLIYITLKLY